MTALHLRRRRPAHAPEPYPPLPSRTVTAQWHKQVTAPPVEPDDEVPAPMYDPLAPEWRPNPMRDCSQCHSEQLADIGPTGYRCRRCGTEYSHL